MRAEAAGQPAGETDMMAQPSAVQDERVRRALAWLTVERAAYAVLVVVAVGIRLWGLGIAPLAPEEAGQALAGVTAAAGLQPDLTGVSPLLYTLQRVVFMLFGASDGSARFPTALIGGASVLLFFFLGNRLTRGGALMAAAVWAFSPLAVWSSRLGIGEALVAPLALAALAGLNLYASRRDSRTLVGTGVSLGLLLIAGRNAYTALLGLVLAGLLLGFDFGALWAGLRTRRAVWIGLIAAFTVGGTCFFLSPAGLAAAVALVGRWAQGILPGGSPSWGGYGASELVYRLVLSEFALLAFGIAGIAGALRRNDSFGMGAAIAGAVAWLIAIAGRGRHPADLALTTLALALLAGPVMARAIRNVRHWRGDRDTWIFVGAGAVLLFAALLAFPGAWSPLARADWLAIYTGIFLATLVLFIALWIAYGVWESWPRVGQTLPAVLLVFALLWQVGQMAGLNFDRGAWRQAGVLHQTGAVDLRDLRATLRNLSALHRGGQDDAAVDLVWPQRPGDPALALLRWELRDFANLRVSAAVPELAAPIVITTVEDQPALSGRYSGAEFPILKDWRPAGFSGFDSVRRWVLFREARTPAEETRALVWFDRVTR